LGAVPSRVALPGMVTETQLKVVVGQLGGFASAGDL